MLRRVPRTLRTAVIVTVLLAISASIAQSWSSGTPGNVGYTQTEWGPLGPADRDLLVKVRLAGLWEGPTSEQAEQQAISPTVQEVGRKLAEEHAQLDLEVRKVADQLGVLLPSRPSAQQLDWMNELSGLTGTEYDRTYIQRVRAAHGEILPAIAEVRTGTRNELVRRFAVLTDSYVARHCEYLESTGMVDYADLPEPPSPGLLSEFRGPIDLIVPGLVVLAAVFAAIALFSAMRRRSTPVRGPTPDQTARAIAAIGVPVPRAEIPRYRCHPDPYGTGPHTRVSETGPRHAVRR